MSMRSPLRRSISRFLIFFAMLPTARAQTAWPHVLCYLHSGFEQRNGLERRDGQSIQGLPASEYLSFS